MIYFSFFTDDFLLTLEAMFGIHMGKFQRPFFVVVFCFFLYRSFFPFDVLELNFQIRKIFLLEGMFLFLLLKHHVWI